MNENIPFAKPSIDKNEEEAVLKVLRSGWLTTAKVTLEFEKEFAQFLNNTNNIETQKKLPPITALAVNSNTSGMILAMKAAGVGKGNYIVTSPYTFNSTPASAIHLGANVIFCDTAPNSYNIDTSLIEEKIQKDKEHKISAIVPVHIGGNVCNMQHIINIVKSLSYKVNIIEDCAHAFPSLTDMGYAGTLGDFGVFSFYANKVITTAEGGMVTTRNKKAAEYINTLRLHGFSRSLWDRYTASKASWYYDIIDLGYKFNLPDILSAIGREQLKKVEIFLQKRCAIATKYNEAFSSCPIINLPPNLKGNAWLLYMIRLNLDMLKIDRDTFAKHLQDKGIGISVHFIPSFKMTYWKKLYPTLNENDFPNALKTYNSTISLPFYPDMTDNMVNRVIEVVLQTAKEYTK